MKRINRYRAAIGAVLLAVGVAACAPTDADTAAKVRQNLATDPLVSASSIDVNVQNKTATLAGDVDTRAIRDQALSLARRTDGVNEVVDRLVVRGGGHGHALEGRHGPADTGRIGPAPGETRQ